MKLTQQCFDLCMDYVGLNMKASSLLFSTPYTCVVRWHKRNHEVYDHFNYKIAKYVGDVYTERATYSPVTTFEYKMPATMTAHIDNWKAQLASMKATTYEMYEEAKEEVHDFILVDKIVCLNKVICNEILSLDRFKRRIEGLPESELLMVNHKIHDYFEEHPDILEIDMAL